MTNYEMPDLTGASCAGFDVDVFYGDIIVEKVIPIPIGDKVYNMTRSTQEIQNSYLRKICLGCPVLQECREWAILHETQGFWGGLTPIERESERVIRGIRVDEPDYYIPSGNGAGQWKKETDWEEEENYARDMVNG